ncbi:PQQ-binding-like beta-propeller repeat protein [Candidatus Bipolaricaulota bacterium]|nr:PQQ-binding-like beta-propeller repeat protein [Candidatus Bipolaricaulota bacterium]
MPTDKSKRRNWQRIGIPLVAIALIALAGVSSCPGTGAPGTLRWRYETGGSVNSSPAIGADGTVYVGSTDRYLYALTSDGRLKWRYETGQIVVSSPAIGADGTVYVASDGNCIYALTPDGRLKWRYEGMPPRALESDVYSSPAIGADGTVYVGSAEGYLYALTPDGRLKWRYETRTVSSSPAIGADGTVYVVGSWDDYLYALTPDGRLKWRYDMRGSVWSSQVVSSPAIGADGTVYVGSVDGCLYALTPDGRLRWRYKTGQIVVSSPAIGADGTVYVGSVDRYLYALISDGRLKWRYETGSVWSSPAIGADGTVYVGSTDRYLYALTSDGRLKWRYKTGWGVSSSPAIGADGTVYVGSGDDYLYALHTGSAGLADTPWPMFRHDLKHTGRSAGVVLEPGTTPREIYPVYDYPLEVLDPLGGEIPIYVGTKYSSVKVQQLDRDFPVDYNGNIKLKHLDIYKILATGSKQITIDADGKRRMIKLLFSVPKGSEFDFLKEAGREWITGFLGDEENSPAWEGSVTFPTSLYETLALSWAVEDSDLEDFYQGLDEVLKLLQFVYLLLDPDVKGYLENRLQEAKQTGRSSEIRAIYKEIEKVLITMGASKDVTIKIPDISLDMNYNFMLGTVEIPYEIDLFKDEEIRLWVTIDESENFLDPGGVILHIQTNVFDLDKFSEIIKMSLEAGSLGIDLALDLIGVVALAAGQAVDEVGEFFGTLKDLGIWALKSVVSFGSVFLDYRADFAVSLVQEREPGYPESIEELAEVLRDQKDTYLFYEEINHLLLFDTFVGPHFKLPPVKPIYRLLSHLSDELPSLPSIYVGLHISDEIVKPLEYKRLLTEIKSRLEAQVDSTLEVECQSDLFQELNFNFKEAAVWSFDTGTIERPEILLKVEEVSTDDLLSKMYGVGEVTGEVAADLGGILVGKFVELVLPSFIDTSAKKVTEKLVAEIAMKVGEDIAGMIYSFIFGAVYDRIFDSAVTSIQDALPELPNIDLYILRLGTSILAVPSNLISNNQISLPLVFDTTIALPGEPFPPIMSCTIKCGLSLEIDFSESGTEQKGNMLWVLAQNLTGVDLDPPVFAGLKNATAGDGEVALSWEEAVDVSPPITYKVYTADESGEQDFASPIYVTEDTSCTIAELGNLQSYYFVVRAQDSQGHEDENTVEKAGTPLPLIPFIGELSWTLTLASHADLHLYDQQDRHVGKNYETEEIEEEIPNASFKLKADGRQVIEVFGYESGRYRIELVGTSNGDYTLTSEARQGEQIVSSRAVSGTIKRGEEKTSTAFAVVPQGRLFSVFVELPLVRPHGLIAKPGHSSVSLSWPAYKETGFDVVGYNIYRSDRNATRYKKANEAVVQNRSFRDTELVKETEYTYVITAVDTSGYETGYSRAVHVIPGLERGLGVGVIIAIVVGVLGLITAGLLIFRFLRSRYYI